MPFAFASHFAPAHLEAAIEIYRSSFRPSEQLDRPRLMLGANVVAAETDAEAAWLFTSLQQTFVNLRRGRPTQVPPPSHDFDRAVTPFERAQLDSVLGNACVGSRETVRAQLQAFVRRTGADELIVASQIFDHAARLRSYEITAAIRDALEV